MKNSPRISDAEWEVMKAVWDHEPLTAVEVMKQLPHVQWKQKTVNTFLTRLKTKGVVLAERVGRANVYRSLMSEKQCRGMEEPVSEEGIQRRGDSTNTAFYRERRPAREGYRGIEANVRKERPSRWLIFSGHAGMFLSALVC